MDGWVYFHQKTMTALTSTAQTGESDRILINKLFKCMAAIKPAWKQAFDNTERANDAKREWLTAFQQNNINTIEQLEKGLAEARRDPSPFLPSIGQFIVWCKDEESDASLEMRFMNICALPTHRRNWSLLPPVLYWIYREIGAFQVNRSTQDKLERKFKTLLKQAKKLEREGFVFHSPPTMLTDGVHEPKMATPEGAKASYSNIKDLLKT